MMCDLRYDINCSVGRKTLEYLDARLGSRASAVFHRVSAWACMNLRLTGLWSRAFDLAAIILYAHRPPELLHGPTEIMPSLKDVGLPKLRVIPACRAKGETRGQWDPDRWVDPSQVVFTAVCIQLMRGPSSQLDHCNLELPKGATLIFQFYNYMEANAETDFREFGAPVPVMFTYSTYIDAQISIIRELFLQASYPKLLGSKYVQEEASFSELPSPATEASRPVGSQPRYKGSQTRETS